MCGIFCELFFKPIANLQSHTVYTKIKDALQHRGPDCVKEADHLDNFFIAGSVLSHQGNNVTEQPLISDSGSFLLFNGDIFGTEYETPSESDTRWLFKKLIQLKSMQEVLDFLANIQGPFSIIFYHNELKSLIFGRDHLGRNSLLFGKTKDSIFITSVAGRSLGKTNVVELPSLGIYVCNKDSDTNSYSISLNPWTIIDESQIRIEKWTELQEFYQPMSIREPLKKSISAATKPGLFNFNDFKSLVHSVNEDELFETILTNSFITEATQSILSLLNTSVKHRVITKPVCRVCIGNGDTKCNHPRIGILFSGGVDCSILAILLHKNMEHNVPIELINVCFEKLVRDGKSNSMDFESSPDRITANKSVEILRDCCPEREWRLVKINISRNELEQMLHFKIADLIYPLETVLDESLGAGFWFASRGVGEYDGSPYICSSRVLLVGSGADEIFGGYTRHRKAFDRDMRNLSNVDDFQELNKELILDIDRLPYRNLNRDDRVIGDHGVTARSPYVEENLINYVCNLKAEQRCFPLFRPGIGDKLLLRLCAYRLNLNSACYEKKRAFQFGSNIANKKQNAKDISLYLKC